MKKKSFFAKATGTFTLRVLLLAIVTLAAVSNLRSQGQVSASTSALMEQPLTPKYRWGIKGGINGAYQYTDKGTTNTRTGIHVGIFMEAALSAKIDIQPELLYSMQGAETAETSTTYASTDKSDYIILPVMFKIYVNQSRTFSIDLGPQLGYMISYTYSISNGKSGDVYDANGLQKLDLSACFGISYKLNPSFHLGLRFNYGITKIYSGADNRNGVVQLSAGYMF